MVRGVRVGVDVGKARIGLAQSDPDGLLATPVATIARTGEQAMSELCASITAVAPLRVYVGLPLSLDGSHTASTADALDVALFISQALDTDVRLIDERLTTVSAQAVLHKAGKSVKSSRSVIDQVAAVMILQHALDSERAQGKPAGANVADVT